MRTPRWLMAAVLLALLGSGCTRSIRVMTYNIHHGEGLDKKLDLGRIAEVINGASPDLVALQEVDNGLQRSGSADQVAELGRMTDLEPMSGWNLPMHGGKYGNAALSRFKVELWRNHHLPKLEAAAEQRGLMEVLVRVGGRRVLFLATHFDHRPPEAERLASVKAIRELLEQRPGVAVILAGDLNARPESGTIAALREFLTDACPADQAAVPTFPADKPDRRIDYVFYRPGTGLKPVSYQVLPEPVASDHRAVLVEFEFRSAWPGS